MAKTTKTKTTAELREREQAQRDGARDLSSAATVTAPPVEDGVIEAPVVERKRFLLRVVDGRDRDGKVVKAPFHNHAVGGFNFARFSSRPDPAGGFDENGEILMQRLPGQIANLTEDEVADIRRRISQRYIEWRQGAIQPNKPGEAPVPIPYFKGVVKIVPEGRKPEPGWHRAGSYLRIEDFPGP